MDGRRPGRDVRREAGRPAAVEAIRQKLGLATRSSSSSWSSSRASRRSRLPAAATPSTAPRPCFGYSFKHRAGDLAGADRPLPGHPGLAVGAAVLWLLVGVTAGVLSALKRGTLWDRAAMVVALTGVSLPIYFTGLSSLAIFCSGGSTASTRRSGRAPRLVQRHDPAVAHAAFLYAAMYARLTRATMLEAHGRGLHPHRPRQGPDGSTVVIKHAMRSTMTPILTLLGIDLGALMGGAILTETTFSLPGLARPSPRPSDEPTCRSSSASR